MSTADFNIHIIESYFAPLRNLSPGSKLELISRLIESMKTKPNETNTSLKESFGAFETDKTAEELIAELRDSRQSNTPL